MPFVYVKTKAQISCAVTAQLISVFVFATYIVYNPSTFKIRNFKPLACTARFVSDLVGNPEDWYSHNPAHLMIYFYFLIIFKNG